MEDDTFPQSQTQFFGCMASPSWFPAHRQHSRFHLLGREANGRSRRWREMLKRLMKEGKSFYTSKSIRFGYDAVSYSKNFDDGCWKEVSEPTGGYIGDFRWQMRTC